MIGSISPTIFRPENVNKLLYTIFLCLTTILPSLTRLRFRQLTRLSVFKEQVQAHPKTLLFKLNLNYRFSGFSEIIMYRL